MSEDELAAIQARVDGLLPIGYLVTALSGAHSPAQHEPVEDLLYEDLPRLLAEVARLKAQLAAGRAYISLFFADEPPPGGWQAVFGLDPPDSSYPLVDTKK